MLAMSESSFTEMSFYEDGSVAATAIKAKLRCVAEIKQEALMGVNPTNVIDALNKAADLLLAVLQDAGAPAAAAACVAQNQGHKEEIGSEIPAGSNEPQLTPTLAERRMAIEESREKREQKQWQIDERKSTFAHIIETYRQRNELAEVIFSSHWTGEAVPEWKQSGKRRTARQEAARLLPLDSDAQSLLK